MSGTYRLRVLPERLAICRLDPGTPPPPWARGTLVSITHTPEECSLICGEAGIPEGVRCSRGWRALSVVGPLDFQLTGVLARLLAPLAAAEIPVFTLSTYDTDYVLVRSEHFDAACRILTRAGYHISH